MKVQSIAGSGEYQSRLRIPTRDGAKEVHVRINSHQLACPHLNRRTRRDDYTLNYIETTVKKRHRRTTNGLGSQSAEENVAVRWADEGAVVDEVASEYDVTLCCASRAQLVLASRTDSELSLKRVSSKISAPASGPFAVYERRPLHNHASRKPGCGPFHSAANVEVTSDREWAAA
jgi:hypothetical protein